MNSQLIDKTKKSNKRCVNCTHWTTCTPNQKRLRWQSEKDKYCPTADKAVDYWNCCRLFQWNPNKTYKEDTP